MTRAANVQRRRSYGFLGALLRLLVGVTALTPLALPQAAIAQKAAGLTTTTTLSRPEIAVGERVELTLKIVSKDKIAAREPVLAVPPGLLLDGPSLAVSSRTTSINGKTATESTIRVTFGLTGNQPGSYEIAAPAVMVGSQMVTGSPTKLVVVGGASAAPPPSVIDDLTDADDDSPTAKSLALKDGPNDVVFLRAFVDKEQVFVGEQVTMSTYLYYRDGYEMTERTDPRYGDLLRFPLLQDPAATTPIFTRVRDQRYGARLVDRVALIPLRAGKLQTGPSSARLTGRRIGSRVLKISNDVTLDVIEPPLDGRPAGYVVGDVGQFELSASVRPRQIKQGGSLAVNVKIEGSGYIPTSVTPPPVAGVKWLAPQRGDGVTVKGGRVGGYRTLTYVVRVENAGTVNLGSLELPYFDPVSKRYEVTKVDLGSVEVEERPPTEEEVKRAKEAQGSADNDPLASLPKARRSLSAFTPSKRASFELSTLALGVGIPPLLAFLLLGGIRARKAVSERSGSDKTRLSRERRNALSDAEKSLKQQTHKALGSAVERMLAAAIELKTGFKIRGVAITRLSAELSKATSFDDALCKEICAALTDCDRLRFLPEADSSTATEASELLSRSKKLLKQIDR